MTFLHHWRTRLWTARLVHLLTVCAGYYFLDIPGIVLVEFAHWSATVKERAVPEVTP